MAIGDPSAVGASSYLPVALVLVSLLLVAGVVWMLLVFRRRRIVCVASSAIKHVDELNAQYQQHMQKHSAIRADFPARVDSKAKYDRFDLGSYLTRSALDNEQWFQQEITLRVAPVNQYNAYRHDFELIAHLELGKAGIPESVLSDSPRSRGRCCFAASLRIQLLRPASLLPCGIRVPFEGEQHDLQFRVVVRVQRLVRAALPVEVAGVQVPHAVELAGNPHNPVCDLRQEQIRQQERPKRVRGGLEIQPICRPRKRDIHDSRVVHEDVERHRPLVGE
jgi:hypothetical protein